MRRIETCSIALALVISTTMASQVAASGGDSKISTNDAVQRSPYVLLVDKADPPTEIRVVHIPYKNEDGSQAVADIETAFSRFVVVKRLHAGASITSSSSDSYIHPGTTHTADYNKLAKVGDTILVVDSGTITSNEVKVRAMRDGARKIPLYVRLADGASYEQIEKGKRFVLLAGYDTQYESFRGVGGHGLLPLSSNKQVMRALKKKR